MLLQVVVPRHRPEECPTNLSGGNGPNSSGSRRDNEDPAAEWLYLMFCCFIKEELSGRVYDNVGVAAVRHRSICPSDPYRQRLDSKHEGEDRISSAEAGGGEGAKGSSSGTASADGRKLASRDSAGEEVFRLEMGNGMEDSFFPVTPEQLVVLNMAEVAAGERRCE